MGSEEQSFFPDKSRNGDMAGGKSEIYNGEEGLLAPLEAATFNVTRNAGALKLLRMVSAHSQQGNGNLSPEATKK